MTNEAAKAEHRQSTKYQFLAASVVSLFLINYGVATGWTSPSIELLKSEKSPLPTGKITTEEGSWIGSLMAIGGAFGNIIFGIIIKNFGRKWPLVALSIPTIISWLLIWFAQNVYYLYAARILQGAIIGAKLSTCPVYFVEIASDHVRGILGTTVGFGGSVGILLAFALGNYSEFYVTPIYCIVTTVLYCVLFSFFPETPVFLVRKNRIFEAEKSLRFYRSIQQSDNEILQLEMAKLKSAVCASETEKNDNRRLQWSDFTTKPGSRALTIAFALVLLNQWSGITAILSYTATIFDAAGTPMSPNTSAMIVGIIQLIGTFVVTPLIERAGRRFLYIVSTIGTAFGLIVLGTYMMLNSSGFEVKSYNWIPIVAFSFAIFVSSFAIQPLPVAVTAEVLPDKLKEIGVTFAITSLSALGFVVMKFLPILGDLVGFHGCLFFFAAICLFGTGFIINFLPETKGKSYEEIMDSL